MAVERLFSMPFLHRVWLGTSGHNLASQKLARKLGFTLEGVMRDHHVIDGKREDRQVWGLLRPEWEARRVELSRVLASSHGPGSR
jgi:ribosomal-protein-alanine N-acetyltransferase